MNTKNKAGVAPAQSGNSTRYCTCGHTEEDHLEGLGVGACWNGSGSGNRCSCQEYNPIQESAPARAGTKLQPPPLTGYDCPCARKGLTHHSPDCLYYSSRDVAPAQCGQHTRGKWFVAPRNHTRSFEVITEDGELICTLDHWGKRQPDLTAGLKPKNEPEANARLIAAAPELLEALKNCFAMLTSPKFSGWIDANCADDELWAMTQAMIQRRDEARAAIARAERGN